MCRGRIESMGVAGVNPRVVGDESATEILPFKGVDDARHRHEHLVRVKSTVVVWRIVLTPRCERPHVGRALFLHVQLADLLAPLVTFSFAIGLIGSHAPIETQIIAVREEKVAAAQAIVGLRESRGERFAVDTTPTVLKIVRVGDVTIVSQATVFVGNEIQVADVGEGLVTVRTIAAKKAVREQFVVIRGVLATAVGVVEICAQVDPPPEVTGDHTTQLLLAFGRSAGTGVEDVGVGHFNVIEVGVRGRENISIEGVSKDEIARLGPSAEDPRLERCPHISRICTRQTPTFHQGMICGVEPVRIHRCDVWIAELIGETVGVDTRNTDARAVRGKETIGCLSSITHSE